MAKRGRKPREISKEVQDIILALVETGDSDRRVAKITKLHPQTWRGFAEKNKDFRALLEKAKEQRHGGLGRTLRLSMVTQIKKGHPWWAKLAIHNYNVLLKDPDVIGAAKVKRLLAQAQPHDPNAYVETDPAVASAQIPCGAIPAVPQRPPVQDRAGGATVGKDGNRQAPSGA